MSQSFSYRHQINRRSRSLRLKVEQSGEVVVVTPPNCPPKLIEEFVNAHISWIDHALAKISQKAAFSETDQEIFIFGKKYLKKTIHNSKLAAGATIVESEFLINLPHLLPSDNVTESSAKVSMRFLKNAAQNYIVPRTKQLSELMGITYRQLEFRQQKTRWGSCSSTGTLSFNWRLVHAPPKVIDYVIIHELSHRVHMNHSAAFWNLVSRFDPDHPQHRGWLKRHGVSTG